jgi:hypothetical protein
MRRSGFYLSPETPEQPPRSENGAKIASVSTELVLALTRVAPPHVTTVTIQALLPSGYLGYSATAIQQSGLIELKGSSRLMIRLPNLWVVLAFLLVSLQEGLPL